MAFRRRLKKPDEDRDLDEHRQAAAGGIDAVLLVELHHLFVHLAALGDVGLGLLILGPQSLDLRLELGHLGHGFRAAVGQGKEEDLDEEGQDNDGEAPVGDEVVDEPKGIEQELGDETEEAEADDLLGVVAEVGQRPELLGPEEDFPGVGRRQEEMDGLFSTSTFRKAAVPVAAAGRNRRP